MLQARSNTFRSRLRVTASALVVAAAGLSISAANGAVTVASGGSYNLKDAAVGTYIIPTGMVGELRPSWSPPASAASAHLVGESELIAGTNASAITVNSGGTLHIYNPWYYAKFTSMINAAAGSTVILDNHGDTNFFGANYFNGDLYLHFDPAEAWSPPVADMGQDWNISNNYFGTASRIIMDNSTAINFYEPNSVTNAIDKFMTTSGTATINFNNGTMVVNGVNTNAAPFAGTVTVGRGATFMVGDAAHASAVFGDPVASNVAITVNQSGGTIGTLKGYGTIFGNVVNHSVVAPGGTTGTPGTLNLRGNYTQATDGELTAEVTPTGVSKLAVSGTASLAGTLKLKIDSGNYSAPGLYDILTAGTKTGSFSTISVQGNAAFAGVISTDKGYKVVVESQNSAQTYAHQVSAARYNVTEMSRALLDHVGAGAGGAKYTAWLAPYGDIENIGRDGLGYNNTVYGVRGGVEYHPAYKSATIGFAASYGHSELDSKGEAASSSANLYNAAIYGGLDFDYGRVDATVFVGGLSSDISRNLGTNGTAKSSPDGTTYGASFKLSKSLFHDWVEPYVSGYFTHIKLDGVSETGNDNFALSYNGIGKNFMAMDLGAKVHLIKQPGLKLDVNVAVEHDFSDRGETVKAGFAKITGSAATYLWRGDAENAIVAGVYFGKTINDKLDLFARADTQFSLYRRAADFSVGAKYHF